MLFLSHLSFQKENLVSLVWIKTDENGEESTSAIDGDITPSTSSQTEPQNQVLSSPIPPLPHSTPDIPFEILDIGKLLELGIDLKMLSREHLYRILRAEPCVEPSAYPRTPAYPGSTSMRQFQPAWFKQYPWLHYSCH